MDVQFTFRDAGRRWLELWDVACSFHNFVSVVLKLNCRERCFGVNDEVPSFRYIGTGDHRWRGVPSCPSKDRADRVA